MAVIDLVDSKQNKLGLVNKCLLVIGETPLPDGTIPSELPIGTDAEIASRIVDETWLEVLNRGWWFNIDEDFPLTPDNLGFISLPPSVIRIDSGRNNPYTVKQGMIYNKLTRSFKFTDTIYIDLIWATNYSELSVAAYEYIGARASRKFQQQVIGAESLNSYASQNEVDALVNLQRENAQYQDSSLLELSISNRWVNPSIGL